MRPGDPNAGGAICEEVEASLRRLQTDYIDLYWMRQWDVHTPKEALQALDDPVREDKVRAAGVSNTPACLEDRVFLLGVRGGERPGALRPALDREPCGWRDLANRSRVLEQAPTRGRGPPRIDCRGWRSGLASVCISASTRSPDE